MCVFEGVVQDLPGDPHSKPFERVHEHQPIILFHNLRDRAVDVDNLCLPDFATPVNFD